MLEEFVSLGKWWLPNNPEVVVPGKLSFSPESGATLELIGSFYSSQFQEIGEVDNISLPYELFPDEHESNVASGVELEFIKPKETIILGLLDNHEEISLYRCSGRIGKFEFVKGRTQLSFHVEYVFRKIHFSNEQDIKFKSISVQYSYLKEWIGKSGIQAFVSNEENKLWISYQPPSNIHLTKICNLDLDITFSQIYVNPFDFYLGAIYYTANIEQKTYLTIKNPFNLSLDECVKMLMIFRDLLSFAMTKPTSVIEIKGKTDNNYTNPVRQADGSIKLEEELRETQVIILFSLWNSAKNSQIKISTNDMLFLFRDVENNFGEILETWSNKQERYESVFDLLMTTMYTPNLYLHYGFINIIQALEAYHTNKYEGIYQDRKVYEKGLYKQFIEILNNFPGESVDKENGISDEFRNALKGKLKAQTRFTLQTRLKELLSEVSSLLPDDFIGGINDRELFSRRAADTRNALTHHDKEKREQAAKGQELFQLFHTLKVILQICLMRELNFTNESIAALVKRNRAYQNEWRPSSN
ncbi:hypothetical protein NIES2107_08300 [Nostoc carneum NIES-2107]|nr:hypothetical protein NIES2107_08300 [Nostoc carneum NIES-2107]